MQKRPGPEGIAVFDANYRVSKVGEYFIYAVFLLGLALVGLSDPVWKFSQTWVWLAIVLYLVALGISHGVLFPALKRMRVLMRRDGRRRAAARAGRRRRSRRCRRSASGSERPAPRST